MSEQSDLAKFDLQNNQQRDSDNDLNAWKERTFSDVIDINDYPRLEKEVEQTHVGMKQVEENVRKVRDTIQKEYNYSKPRFKNGDTLFARITPCLENGKTAFVDILDEGEAATGSTEFLVMSATDDVLPKFIYYTARRPDVRQYAIKRMTGSSGRQRVPTNVFDNLTIRVPPLEDQKQIIDFLDNFDTKIETNHRIEDLLDEIAHTLFQRAFTSGSEVKSIYTDTSDRETVKLGEVATLDRGLSYSSAHMDETGYGLVNLKNIEEGGGFAVDELKLYSGPHKDRHHVHPGEVIIAITEQTLDGKLIGSPAVIPPHPNVDKTVISQDVGAVRPDADNALTSEFLYYLLKDRHFRAYAESNASGTTVYHLKLDDVANFEFVLPDADKIETFSEVARSCWQYWYTILHENSSIAEMRNTLLPKLMKGELHLHG